MEKKINICPVRIQWDPEKDLHEQNLNYRSIQIGITDIAVEKYVNDWIVSMEDITPLCKEIHSLIRQEKISEAKSFLPLEGIYPVRDDLKKIIVHS